MNKKARLEATLNSVWYKPQTKKPWFWPGLLVLEAVYRGLRALSRQAEKSRAARQTTSPPVLVVGNLVAGGAGKTPVVLAVCQFARARGLKVGVLSRGYGRNNGRSGGSVTLVSPGQQFPPASLVGDEPLYLAQQSLCPIAVGPDRAQALKELLAAHGPFDLIVSDDGLQHHRLARSMEWLVFDERAAGNGRLLPAGPLREPLSRINQVDHVLASNTPQAELAQKLGYSHPESNWHEVTVQLTGFANHQTGQHLTLAQAASLWADQQSTAFAGLGNPAKFFSALERNGVHSQRQLALPDHANYPADFLQSLGPGPLITTGKDAVKLNKCAHPNLWIAQIDVVLPQALTRSLEEQLGLPTN